MIHPLWYTQNNKTMKSLLPLIFSLTIILSGVNAQISLDSAAYFPVVGDTLFSATDNAPTGITITAAGGDQTWDFSSLQSGITSMRIIQPLSDAPNPDAFPGANAYIAQQLGGNGFYRSSAESFAIIGFEGEDPLGQGIEVETPFTPPYIERWGSLDFFDLNNLNSALTIAVAADDIPGNIFDGLPISPDSIRVRVVIDRTDLVDAWGSMTIPGGTYDVLREKRTEIREIRLDAKISILPWTDITDIAIDALPIDELGIDTTVTYNFWSNDAKEPIAVITTDANESAITAVTYKYNDVISSIVNINPSTPELYVYPNPVVIQTRFEFSNMPEGEYQLDIYNLTGQSVWSKKYHINDYRLETVNLSRLQKGMYLYQLRDENGKQIATNRLIIATP